MRQLFDGRVGYIDKEGHFAINPQFHRPMADGFNQEEACSFNQGLAAMKVGRAWGYINVQGVFVIRPQFDLALPFEGPLAEVRLAGKTGYIDKTGRYVWRPSD